MQIAKADLAHIKMYIEQDSVYYANKTVQEIKEKIDKLLIFPYMGRCVPEFNSKLIREIIYKSYRIMYYISSNNIYIIKNLHHSQNILYFKSKLFH